MGLLIGVLSREGLSHIFALDKEQCSSGIHAGDQYRLHVVYHIALQSNKDTVVLIGSKFHSCIAAAVHEVAAINALLCWCMRRPQSCASRTAEVGEVTSSPLITTSTVVSKKWYSSYLGCKPFEDKLAL